MSALKMAGTVYITDTLLSTLGKQEREECLAFLLKLCSFSSPICQKAGDKYSLRQTKINGWVQKCTGQPAAKEDAACTGHMQTACLCHRNSSLHGEENSCDTVTINRAGNGDGCG